MQRKYRNFVGDFETTVYDGQTKTEVWASGLCELFSENAIILNSIENTFAVLKGLDGNIRVYYHNLKFDGAFWIDFLLRKLKFSQAIIYNGNQDYKFIQDNDMKNNTFKYLISSMGQWYSITIKVNDKYIILQDSLKLLPFSVKSIGESFQTKHRKLEMEYKGFRQAGGVITNDEAEYLKNDLYVVKEALEIMVSEKHTKMTIGSCCLEEFRKTHIGEYKGMFPRLENISLNEDIYGSKTADEYIRNSYKGGWCYLVKGKENKVFKDGITLDVNSLYPSVMSGESGNKYPIGEPTFWCGAIPQQALNDDKFFFIRVKTKFNIKKNFLPFIQNKNNLAYKSNECLTTSKVLNDDTGEYLDTYYVGDKEYDTSMVLTFTQTDYYLFLKHYDVYEFEILDGCYFETEIGIFDKYINKYKEIKLKEKGAKRQLAKLFLNNLYGKMATSTNSSFKVLKLCDDGVIRFDLSYQNDKLAGYIAIGSAITSYARNFTIKVAQLNYDENSENSFIYSDTDSIHCNMKLDDIKGVKIHDKDFLCWKAESNWDIGLYVRQKTYIEHITHENQKQVATPYYDMKCAGMSEKCKELFITSITDEEINLEEYTQEEQAFLSVKREITDFKVGLVVPSKLMPKRIEGGIILKDTTFELR